MKSFLSLFKLIGIIIVLVMIEAKNGVHAEINWASIPEGTIVGPGVGRVKANQFCDVIKDDSMELNEALRGRNLSVVVQYGPGFDFFQYDPREELSEENPSGMIATLLDDLAERAGFFWRNSFVAYNTTSTDILHGTGAGKWDRMLNWTTSNFDLSVDKWYVIEFNRELY